MTNSIECPHCHKPLFHTQALSPEHLAVRLGDPEVQHDERGYFVRCPECAERVDLDHRSIPGSGGRFSVRR